MEWQKHCCQCLTNKSLHSSIAIYVLWSNYQQWWRTTSNLGFCSAWVTLSDYLSAAATVCPWIKSCLKLHLKLLISLNTHISLTSLLELDLAELTECIFLFMQGYRKLVILTAVPKNNSDSKSWCKTIKPFVTSNIFRCESVKMIDVTKWNFTYIYHQTFIQKNSKEPYHPLHKT